MYIIYNMTFKPNESDILSNYVLYKNLIFNYTIDLSSINLDENEIENIKNFINNLEKYKLKKEKINNIYINKEYNKNILDELKNIFQTENISYN